MKKIYLIRHGQSEWNVLGKIQGQKNTKLTSKGIEQAKLLGNRLISEDIDIIYSSNLDRAVTTGEIISNRINKNLIKTSSLDEINFGPWEGLRFEEIKQKYKSDYKIWSERPDELKLLGGESLEELKNRTMKFIDDLYNSKYNKIAIVSHSATLKVIILNMLGIGNAYYKNITLNNVSLSIIECRKYNNVLTLLNDISHLKEL